MTDPIILLIVLDFLILLLCLVILFDRRRSKAPEELAGLPETFDRLVQETEEFLSRAHNEMQEKRGSFERMLQEIQSQGKSLNDKITEAKHFMKQYGGQPPGGRTAPAPAATDGTNGGGQDPYEQAIRLFEEGIPVHEISQRLHLTRSELELVLGLQSVRGASALSAKSAK